MGETQENLSGGRLRSRWTTLATIGLLMVALGPTLILASGFIWGLDISDDLGFFGMVMAAAVIAALLVLFFGWWAKIIGILVGLGGAFMLFWTVFGLQQPASFFDFVPGVLVIPGGIIAAVSCIAAIFAGGRGRTGSETTGGERTAIRVVLTVVVLAMLASGVLTYTGRQTVADASDAAQTVQARDFLFDPVEFEVDGGDTILVQNDDPYFHTFTIDELNINVELGPGSQAPVEIPNQRGTYRFYCVPHTEPSSEEADPDEAMDPEEALEEKKEEGPGFDMSGTMTIS